MQHAYNLPADRKTPLVSMYYYTSRGLTKNEVKTKYYITKVKKNYYINTTMSIKLENNLDSMIVW